MTFCDLARLGAVAGWPLVQRRVPIRGEVVTELAAGGKQGSQRTLHKLTIKIIKRYDRNLLFLFAVNIKKLADLVYEIRYKAILSHLRINYG